MPKKNYICLIAFILIFALSGCSLTKFPGDDYVESVMDYFYRGDFEGYQTFTNENNKNLQKVYEKGVKEQTKAYLAYFGLDDISDQAYTKLEAFVKMVYEYASYEITDAVLEEKKQEITVLIRPVAFYSLASKEIDAYAEQFRQQTEDGKYLYEDEKAYQSAYLEGLLKVYEKHLDDITYLDEQTFTITLRKSGSEYIPGEGEFEKIDAAVIAFSKDVPDSDGDK